MAIHQHKSFEVLGILTNPSLATIEAGFAITLYAVTEANLGCISMTLVKK
jgi:hypothetical protein